MSVPEDMLFKLIATKKRQKKKKRRGLVMLRTELSDNYNGILVHIISLADLRCRH